MKTICEIEPEIRATWLGKYQRSPKVIKFAMIVIAFPFWLLYLACVNADLIISETTGSKPKSEGSTK